MIRDILVNLSLGSERDPAAVYAASLAAACKAHITGLAVSYEIDVPPFYMGALPTDFIDQQIRENEAAATTAAGAFTALAREHGLSYDVRTLSGSLGDAAAAVGDLSRLYDLTVVAQPDPDRPGPEEVLAESALMDSGRGVLVVPYVQKPPFSLSRVVVAWDGSRASARALAESLPLLHMADSRVIFSVRRSENEEATPNAADLERHLAHHGLSAELRHLTIGSGESISSAILNEVSDQGADLVVMGGYGHSRVRELVFGGVTRDILGSMTAPVLLAH
ncbi:MULTISPECIES: universal stress protein [Azorhizobium]|jgi:nucleotide-binding universal stress UspA family protein|uniref:Universal stress protein n=1 Tax=Azorhizobium caulinodans (strain ATCC 43989 / DSM 5975 / JCM 20966 / LMG 6465 / NBRC 14845 / NCIMB 13405 / ORS 571) TaxID=438753 RepID=A8HX81_AZOC5|nr:MULTISPECIES: universal stress protein [Azorhizobium]TDT94421.1 universal stress protein family protein [Azorhizobium sp. AG788]BAF87469.1 universal stress protein [Azorhizobium caulinodans ORS 571]